MPPNEDDPQKSVSAALNLEEGRRQLEELEARLYVSEERFRTLVESTSDWIWETDEHDVYTYASPKVKDLLGYTPEEVLGKTALDFMPPEEANRLKAEFARISKEGKPFAGLENINLRKDGRRVVLETSGVPILARDGALRGWRGIDRDITERKRVQDEIVAAKDYTENIIKSITDTLIVVDPHTKIKTINKATSDLLGYKKDELIGKPVATIFAEEEKMPFKGTRLKKLIGEGSIRDYDIAYRTKSGEKIPVIECCISNVSKISYDT